MGAHVCLFIFFSLRQVVTAKLKMHFIFVLQGRLVLFGLHSLSVCLRFQFIFTCLPCRESSLAMISTPNCHTRIPGKTIQAPLGIIHRNTNRAKELCPVSANLKSINQPIASQHRTRCNIPGASTTPSWRTSSRSR